jgi:hypothetical protein
MSGRDPRGSPAAARPGGKVRGRGDLFLRGRLFVGPAE